MKRRGCHGPQMTGMADIPGIGPVPNPRPATSIWSQDEFIQILRTGIRPNGVPLGEDMPWQTFAPMTDEDLAAIYAYLIAPVQ